MTYMHTRRLISAFAVFTVAAVAGAAMSCTDATPADAAETPSYTATPTTTTMQATETGGLTPIMALPAREFAAGERVLVTARLAGQSNAEKYPRMAIRTDAVGPVIDGVTTVERGPTVATNHLGQAYGTEYLTTRWLFIAPAAGSYTLTLRGEATTYLDTENTQLTVINGGGTYLKTSEVSQDSTTWGPANDSCVGSMNHPAPTDSTACSNVVDTKKVLVKTTTTNGRTLTLINDLELSREYGSYPGGDSVVRINMAVRVLRADGTECAYGTSGAKDVTITSRRHHLHHTITKTGIDTSCGEKVYTYTRVTHLSGNPVAIHDAAQSNAIALLS